MTCVQQCGELTLHVHRPHVRADPARRLLPLDRPTRPLRRPRRAARVPDAQLHAQLTARVVLEAVLARFGWEGGLVMGRHDTATGGRNAATRGTR